MNPHETYENPLISRYASREMAELWSSQRKFSTWRRLWVALAEAERDLGLNISEAQISELRAQIDDDRLRGRPRPRAAAPSRRDGPRPHLRRRRAHGPADHPPGRDQLLRHRQHRPDPDPRGARTWSATGSSARSTPWPTSPLAGRTCPASATPTSSPRSSSRSASARRSGATSWSSTSRRSSTG